MSPQPLKDSIPLYNTSSQVTIRWAVISTKFTQKGQTIILGPGITHLLYKYSLVESLSCKSYQKKTNILEGAQLNEIRGRIKLSIRREEEEEESKLTL